MWIFIKFHPYSPAMRRYLAFLILGLIQPALSWSGPGCFQLGDPPLEGQLTFYGSFSGGALSGLPVATGDYDGDGYLDLIMSPMRARITSNGPPRSEAGAACIYFGNGSISGSIDSSQSSPDQTVIFGAREGDHTGNEVWAGDVNGDGIDDILLCAQDAGGPSGNGRQRAGRLYILFGSPGLRGQQIDLLNPPQNICTVYGMEAGDRLGMWVRAEDWNGDSIDDLLVGADGADGPLNERLNCGSAYLLYGKAAWPAQIDLAVSSFPDVVTFHGRDPQDRFGSTLNGGDFNGDGLIDITIGAGLTRAGAALGGGPAAGGGDGPTNDRFNAGEACLFFQPETGWPAVMDVADPPASVSMTILYGKSTGDYCGEELAAGDLNRDGADEWLVGAFPADNLAGRGYIFQGGKHLENRTIDLLSPPGNLGMTTLLGGASPDIASDTMLTADIDNDSYPDLMIGSPMAALGKNENVGRLDIFFGRTEPFPSIIPLASPPAGLRHFSLCAPERGDILTYSLTAGDWDKDGYADPMPNGMNGDGYQNDYPVAGDAYIFSGKKLAEMAEPPQSTPTPTATPTVTPTSTFPPDPTPTPTRSADFNGDGRVDAKDLLMLQKAMGEETGSKGAH